MWKSKKTVKKTPPVSHQDGSVKSDAVEASQLAMSHVTQSAATNDWKMFSSPFFFSVAQSSSDCQQSPPLNLSNIDVLP